MESITLGQSDLSTSRLAYGCWRLGGSTDVTEITEEGAMRGGAAVVAAYDAGFTLFDLADVYCDGICETIVGQVLAQVSGMREKILIATKCGIRKKGEPYADSPYRYDFSGEHIIKSCEDSLRRLGIETIDLFQLHRPDYLCDPIEVAEAFSKLKAQGKAREFGVSNFKPLQFSLLQKCCPMPLLVNQVEISLASLDCFHNGTLDQCLMENITPLAWSPLDGGRLGSVSKSMKSAPHPVQLKLFEAIDVLCEERGASRTAIALAWLLKHPSRIVPIIGATHPDHIRAAVEGTEITLTREEWYRLLEAARGDRLP